MEIKGGLGDALKSFGDSSGVLGGPLGRFGPALGRPRRNLENAFLAGGRAKSLVLLGASEVHEEDFALTVTTIAESSRPGENVTAHYSLTHVTQGIG